MTTTDTTRLGHFVNYISLVPDANIFELLEKLRVDFIKLLSSLSEEKSLYAYAPGKWTIKEMTGHLCDAERIFAYRALRFARNDKTRLSSFEEDDFVKATNFNARSMSSLIEEFDLLRRSDLSFFKNLTDEELDRMGASGKAELTAREVLYIIAGHQMHHMNILKERYGI